MTKIFNNNPINATVNTLQEGAELLDSACDTSTLLTSTYFDGSERMKGSETDPIEMLANMQIGGFCNFNDKMGEFMTRLMKINLYEHDITLNNITKGSYIDGDNDSINTHTIKHYSYTKGNNYMDFVKDVKVQEMYGIDATQSFQKDNVYVTTSNLYPDDIEGAGSNNFRGSDKWTVKNKESILYKTKELFKQKKINTIISRFGTNADGRSRSVEYKGSNRTIYYGESHGRNLLKKGAESGSGDYNINGYNNPFCRSWTHHYSYDRLNKTLRPLNGGEISIADFHDWGQTVSEFGQSNLQTKGEQTTFNVEYISEAQKKYYTSQGKDWRDFTIHKQATGKVLYENVKENTSWKAGGIGWEYSVLDTSKGGDGLLRIAPKFSRQGGGKDGSLNNIHTKDCMFSIENLAWKGYDPYSFENALSWEQRGPLGGRIMWFPPYGIQFSENTNVNWSKNSFIGRGEDVYTYVNTQRSGNLSFLMVVDHPSIIDYTIWHDENVSATDNDVHRFFAGCDEGSGEDSLVANVKPTPLTDEGVHIEIDEKDIGDDGLPRENIGDDENGGGDTEKTNIKVRVMAFFPNNYSGAYDDWAYTFGYLLMGYDTWTGYQQVKEGDKFPFIGFSMYKEDTVDGWNWNGDERIDIGRILKLDFKEILLNGKFELFENANQIKDESGNWVTLLIEEGEYKGKPYLYLAEGKNQCGYECNIEDGGVSDENKTGSCKSVDTPPKDFPCNNVIYAYRLPYNDAYQQFVKDGEKGVIWQYRVDGQYVKETDTKNTFAQRIPDKNGKNVQPNDNYKDLTNYKLNLTTENWDTSFSGFNNNVENWGNYQAECSRFGLPYGLSRPDLIRAPKDDKSLFGQEWELYHAWNSNNIYTTVICYTNAIKLESDNNTIFERVKTNIREQYGNETITEDKIEFDGTPTVDINKKGIQKLQWSNNRCNETISLLKVHGNNGYQVVMVLYCNNTNTNNNGNDQVDCSILGMNFGISKEDATKALKDNGYTADNMTAMGLWVSTIKDFMGCAWNNLTIYFGNKNALEDIRFSVIEEDKETFDIVKGKLTENNGEPTVLENSNNKVTLEWVNNKCNQKYKLVHMNNNGRKVTELVITPNNAESDSPTQNNGPVSKNKRDEAFWSKYTENTSINLSTLEGINAFLNDTSKKLPSGNEYVQFIDGDKRILSDLTDKRDFSHEALGEYGYVDVLPSFTYEPNKIILTDPTNADKIIADFISSGTEFGNFLKKAQDGNFVINCNVKSSNATNKSYQFYCRGQIGDVVNSASFSDCKAAVLKELGKSGATNTSVEDSNNNSTTEYQDVIYHYQTIMNNQPNDVTTTFRYYYDSNKNVTKIVRDPDTAPLRYSISVYNYVWLCVQHGGGGVKLIKEKVTIVSQGTRSSKDGESGSEQPTTPPAEESIPGVQISDEDKQRQEQAQLDADKKAQEEQENNIYCSLNDFVAAMDGELFEMKEENFVIAPASKATVTIRPITDKNGKVIVPSTQQTVDLQGVSVARTNAVLNEKHKNYFYQRSENKRTIKKLWQLFNEGKLVNVECVGFSNSHGSATAGSNTNNTNLATTRATRLGQLIKEKFGVSASITTNSGHAVQGSDHNSKDAKLWRSAMATLTFEVSKKQSVAGSHESKHEDINPKPTDDSHIPDNPNAQRNLNPSGVDGYSLDGSRQYPAVGNAGQNGEDIKLETPSEIYAFLSGKTKPVDENSRYKFFAAIGKDDDKPSKNNEGKWTDKIPGWQLNSLGKSSKYPFVQVGYRIGWNKRNLLVGTNGTNGIINKDCGDIWDELANIANGNINKNNWNFYPIARMIDEHKIAYRKIYDFKSAGNYIAYKGEDSSDCNSALIKNNIIDNNWVFKKDPLKLKGSTHTDLTYLGDDESDYIDVSGTTVEGCLDYTVWHLFDKEIAVTETETLGKWIDPTLDNDSNSRYLLRSKLLSEDDFKKVWEKYFKDKGFLKDKDEATQTKHCEDYYRRYQARVNYVKGYAECLYMKVPCGIKKFRNGETVDVFHDLKEDYPKWFESSVEGKIEDIKDTDQLGNDIVAGEGGILEIFLRGSEMFIPSGNVISENNRKKIVKQTRVTGEKCDSARNKLANRWYLKSSKTILGSRTLNNFEGNGDINNYQLKHIDKEDMKTQFRSLGHKVYENKVKNPKDPNSPCRHVPMYHYEGSGVKYGYYTKSMTQQNVKDRLFEWGYIGKYRSYEARQRRAYYSYKKLENFNFNNTNCRQTVQALLARCNLTESTFKKCVPSNVYAWYNMYYTNAKLFDIDTFQTSPKLCLFTLDNSKDSSKPTNTVKSEPSSNDNAATTPTTQQSEATTQVTQNNEENERLAREAAERERMRQQDEAREAARRNAIASSKIGEEERRKKFKDEEEKRLRNQKLEAQKEEHLMKLITAYDLRADRQGNGDKNVLRYDQEYYFFKTLEKRDKIVYDKLMDKIKYFDPAFHSMTPEGFNARLTFLNQCTRQGNTISISDQINTNEGSVDKSIKTANNLAFGRPPYCVLRLGDFYNQMIVINSINIDYSVSDGVQWDMNMEGIGMQPLLARVDINFNFIGGGDMAGPVRRLQNAMTFNYYANARYYDNRADRMAYPANKNTLEMGAIEYQPDVENSRAYVTSMRK